METKIIDLKPFFLMSNEVLVENLSKCFEVLNTLFKNKSGIDYDPLFIEEKRGGVQVGYRPLSKDASNFFSNERIEPSYDLPTRVAIVQLAIFEACRVYGCYEDVPMRGAPEDNKYSYFMFIHDGIEYTYKLWYK